MIFPGCFSSRCAIIYTRTSSGTRMTGINAQFDFEAAMWESLMSGPFRYNTIAGHIAHIEAEEKNALQHQRLKYSDFPLCMDEKCCMIFLDSSQS